MAGLIGETALSLVFESSEKHYQFSITRKTKAIYYYKRFRTVDSKDVPETVIQEAEQAVSEYQQFLGQ